MITYFIYAPSRRHGLVISLLMSGGILLYAFFMSKSKKDDRFPKRISELSLAVKGLLDSEQYLELEFAADKVEDDLEVDAPPVTIKFR